jgi:predicted SAM-dependent methyltransferase
MKMSNLKLHLGCGSNIIPGWNNVDLDSLQADQHLDLTQKLPFKEAEVSRIFTEHFIEHITRGQAVDFLKECYRVLVHNGVIRITTPNLRFLTYAYFTDSINEWDELWQPASRCLMLNEGMRAWGHHFLYDAEELTRILGEAGFKSISFKRYRHSEVEDLVGLESRPFNNELIVEACKVARVDMDIDFSTLNANEVSWSTPKNSTKIVATQATVQIELESNARAEFIKVQAAYIQELEARLAAIQSSFFGKIYSFFSR